MRGRLRNIGTWMLVLWLVIPLSGCDTAVSEAAGSRVTDEEMMPKVAQMVDAQLPTIREYAGDEFEENGSKALDGVTGEEVVQGTLTEEHGREYIAFAYQVDESETREDADKVVDSAKDLLSKEDFAQLEDQITEQKELMLREAAEQAKDIAPSLKPAFYKDLQKVMVKAIVLLVAGMVYARMPHSVWWGKIAAAAGVAVAAGVVAASMMSLYRYYRFGGTKEESFVEWMESITTEPKAAYMMAASMISVNATLKRSPVLTGIILGVFSLYGLTTDMKKLLDRYGYGTIKLKWKK